MTCKNKLLNLFYQLIEELQFLLDDTPPEEITEQEVNQYKNVSVILSIMYNHKDVKLIQD